MGNGSSASAYRKLADLLDGLTENGIQVDHVETGDIDGDTESLAVSLEIDILLDEDDSLRIPADSGAVESSTENPEATGTRARDGDTEPDTDRGPAADTTDENVTDGAGAYECEEPDCSARFRSSTEREIHVETEHRKPDVPAHRNEAALELAYEAFDSFPEMREALGVDVTPQTVRRQAIDAGLHDPDGDGSTEAGDAEGSGAVGGDEAAEQPSRETEARRVTDGSGATATGSSTGGSRNDIDGDEELASEPRADDEHSEERLDVALPDGVGLEDLRTVAVEARTLREAAGELGLSRDRSRELLGDFGLLELVHGRVAERLDREEREERFEEWLADARGESAPGNGS